MKRHSLSKESCCFWFQIRSPPQLWEEGTDSNFWMSLICIQSKRGWTPKLIIQTLPWEGTAAQEISDHFPAASLSPTDKITRTLKPYEWNPNLKWQDNCVHHNMETKLRTRHDIFYYKITSHLIEKGSRLRPALTHRGANFSHSNFQLNFNFDQPSPSPCTSPLTKYWLQKPNRLVAWIRRFRD